MPDRVKSCFEIYKASINFFVMAMNIFIYLSSQREDMICWMTVRQKSNLRIVQYISRVDMFKESLI